MNITNFLQISENLATSGQPTANQFEEIASLGYGTVINLALPTSDHAISNEGELITRHGMNYVHIPVEWDSPRYEQFELFAATMEALKNQKVWVHCVLNMRVSCFVYLYRTKYLGISDSEAQKNISDIWQPDEVWSNFIASAENIGQSTV